MLIDLLIITGGVGLVLLLVYTFADWLATSVIYRERAGDDVSNAVRSIPKWTKNPTSTDILSPSDKQVRIREDTDEFIHYIAPLNMSTPFLTHYYAKYYVHTTKNNCYKVAGRSPLCTYIDELVKNSKIDR